MKKALLEVINFDVKDIITTSETDVVVKPGGGIEWASVDTVDSPYGQ